MPWSPELFSAPALGRLEERRQTVLTEHFFSNGGGIPLEHCRTELPPQAGIAVYVRGDSGGLAAARIYDDVDPPTAGTTDGGRP